MIHLLQIGGIVDQGVVMERGMRTRQMMGATVKLSQAGTLLVKVIALIEQGVYTALLYAELHVLTVHSSVFTGNQHHQ